MYIFTFTAAVRGRFDSIRGSFRRYRIALMKSLALGKSGSGSKSVKQPKPYKYAVEAAFLDTAFKMESVSESMESPVNSSTEVRCNFIYKRIYVNVNIHVSISVDNVNKIYIWIVIKEKKQKILNCHLILKPELTKMMRN